MDLVGYMAYGSLVVFAVAWTMDVRNNTGVDTPAVLRAIYFVAATALIPAFGVNMLHALWVVPFGCFFARVIAPRLVGLPVLSRPFIAIANVFARMVRMGVEA